MDWASFLVNKSSWALLWEPDDPPPNLLSLAPDTNYYQIKVKTMVFYYGLGAILWSPWLSCLETISPHGFLMVRGLGTARLGKERDIP